MEFCFKTETYEMWFCCCCLLACLFHIVNWLISGLLCSLSFNNIPFLFLFLNKLSSMGQPCPSQAPTALFPKPTRSRHLKSVYSVLPKTCVSVGFQDSRPKSSYNSLLIHNISVGHAFLILLSLSVFLLLFIIRHDNVLSGLFF